VSAKSSASTWARLRNAPSGRNGTNARSGRIPVATFLDRPCASDDADHDVGSSGDAFFGDEEMQRTRPGLAESCEESLFRDRVLNEIDVSSEVKP
jgi:hypothetical protein